VEEFLNGGLMNWSFCNINGGDATTKKNVEGSVWSPRRRAAP